MILNPALSKVDRIVNIAAGVAAILYAFLGDIEHLWVRVIPAVLGIVLVTGGIGGT